MVLLTLCLALSLRYERAFAEIIDTNSAQQYYNQPINCQGNQPCTIICDEYRSCRSATFNCPPVDYSCDIICTSNTTTDENCRYSTLNCPSNSQCNINCTQEACTGMDIIFDINNINNINCKNENNKCHQTELRPLTTTNSSIYCDSLCQQVTLRCPSNLPHCDIICADNSCQNSTIDTTSNNDQLTIHCNGTNSCIGTTIHCADTCSVYCIGTNSCLGAQIWWSHYYGASAYGNGSNTLLVSSAAAYPITTTYIYCGSGTVACGPCPDTTYSDVCYMECGAYDCDTVPITCNANVPCYIDCWDSESCQKSTVYAQMATDVTVHCDESDACYKMKLHCGSGECIMECNGYCDGAIINATLATNFNCLGSGCDAINITYSLNPSTSPTYVPTIEPTEMTNQPTTNMPSTAPIVIVFKYELVINAAIRYEIVGDVIGYDVLEVLNNLTAIFIADGIQKVNDINEIECYSSYHNIIIGENNTAIINTVMDLCDESDAYQLFAYFENNLETEFMETVNTKQNLIFISDVRDIQIDSMEINDLNIVSTSILATNLLIKEEHVSHNIFDNIYIIPVIIISFISGTLITCFIFVVFKRCKNAKLNVSHTYNTNKTIEMQTDVNVERIQSISNISNVKDTEEKASEINISDDENEGLYEDHQTKTSGQLLDDDENEELYSNDNAMSGEEDMYDNATMATPTTTGK